MKSLSAKGSSFQRTFKNVLRSVSYWISPKNKAHRKQNNMHACLLYIFQKSVLPQLKCKTLTYNLFLPFWTQWIVLPWQTWRKPAFRVGVIKKTSCWNNVWKMWARGCCKTGSGQRSFKYRAIKLWNDLDENLKETRNFNSFKRHLKSDIMHAY